MSLRINGRSAQGFGLGETQTPDPNSQWRFKVKTSRPLTSDECAAASTAYKTALQVAGNTVLSFSCSGDQFDAVVQFGSNPLPIAVGSTFTLPDGTSVTVVQADRLVAVSAAKNKVLGMVAAHAGIVAAGALIGGATARKKHPILGAAIGAAAVDGIVFGAMAYLGRS
jgi:hypothetical protein